MPRPVVTRKRRGTLAAYVGVMCMWAAVRVENERAEPAIPMLTYRYTPRTVWAMAVDVIRTVADETTDALRALDEAERAMATWRDHLLRIADEADEAPGILYQARRSAGITSALVAQAQQRTRAATQSATLRSIS